MDGDHDLGLTAGVTATTQGDDIIPMNGLVTEMTDTPPEGQ